jgi:hypothetical protein
MSLMNNREAGIAVDGENDVGRCRCRVGVNSTG